MKKNEELIYVARAQGAVVTSQVYELISYIHNLKIFERVTLILIASKKEQKEINKLSLLNGINIKFVRQLPLIFPFHYLLAFFIGYSIKKLQTTDRLVIHIRSQIYGYLTGLGLNIFNVRKPNLLVDIRGAYKEELLEFKNINKFVLFSKLKIERDAMRYLKKKNIKISNVSVYLKNYLQKNYNIKDININIVPCLSSNKIYFEKNSRELLREELGVKKNEILFIFSTGGNGKWQKTDELIKFIANKGYKIINLSRAIIEHKNVINRFVPYQDVYKYLSAADIGIIIRDKSVVNEVAVPVKFCEYVCAGLPIISNKNTFIINDYLNKTKYGYIINDILGIDEMNLKSLLGRRKEIEMEGKARYGIDNIAKSYLQIYNSILSINV